MASFLDRAAAGRALAGRLGHLAGAPGLIVLGLPRGGVPVAAQVAAALGAPLDVLVARKLGVPGQPELAMGAVAPGGVRVVHESVVEALGIPPGVFDMVATQEGAEVERRERSYRGDGPPLDVAGRTVVVVDDGLATGSTMRAAVAALRAQGAGRVVVAVPVGAPETCRELAAGADELVCTLTPAEFGAVGQFYGDFTQTTDDEIRALLGPGPKGDQHGE